MTTPVRAADPTLLDYIGLVGVTLDSHPPQAHRPDGCPRFKGYGGDAAFSVSSAHACWFAVPCRECFPDAPPPGESYDHGEGYAEGHHLPMPHLAWQVTS